MAFDVEQFFESMDIILTQRLSDLQYDKTIIATIVDDSDKSKGHYVVSNGTIKFDAYSNDNSFRIDDQVRITVLNGDWSQKKFIAGKYIAENGLNPVAYVPPLGTVRSDSSSTYPMNNSWTLYTNNEPLQPKLIWKKIITPDSEEYLLQSNGIYNTITLYGDFCTNFDAIAGNYGLLLELFISTELGTIRKFVTFDSSEMIGNPYSFVIDTHQEKQILIASEGIITEIHLSIYESSNFDVDENGNFIVIDNPFIGYDGLHIIDKNPIVFSNIVIGFGSDLTKIEDNKLQLYTTSSTTYHYNGGEGDLTNDKKMGLVWYNKNDKHEYVGFKDGIVDLNEDNSIVQYDEIEYQYLNNADLRLIAQKGISGVPTDYLGLNLAANIEDSNPHIMCAYKSLTGAHGGSHNLIQALQAMGRALGKTALKTELDKLITGPNAILSVQAEIAEEMHQKMVDRYNQVLLYGYETQNDLKHSKSWEEIWPADSKSSYFINCSAAINDAVVQVNNFLTYLYNETAPGKALSGYRGVYDSYANRVKKALAGIDLELDSVIHTSKIDNDSAEQDDELVQLKTYFNKVKDSFIPYAEQDLSSWDNKYCIYWYRYNENYNPAQLEILSQEEWDLLADKPYPYADSYSEYKKLCNIYNFEYRNCRFLGNQWERLYIKDNNDNYIHNFGLPTSIGEKIDNKFYWPANPVEPQILNQRMIPTSKEERYQVVLFYNHTIFKSNVLTFINSEADLIPDTFDVNAQDVLLIEHGAHSQDHYQSYTSAFDLVNIADERRTRELTVSYDGVILGDEALAGAGIYWYVPVNSTMLTYDKDVLVNQLGFTTDIDAAEPTEFSKDGYVYFYKKIRYTKTDVEAKDVDGNLIYNPDGTVATNEEIKLEPVDKYFSYKIKPYYEASAQNNTILVDAYINNVNNEVRKVSGEITLTFGTFGTNGTKYTLVLTSANSQIASLPADPNNTNDNLILNLTLRDAENKLLPLTTDPLPNLSDPSWQENEIVTYSLKTDWYACAKDNAGGIILELAEDQKSAQLIIPKGLEDENGYVGIVKAEISYNTTGKRETESRVITLSTLYPISFSSSNDHYISGPTTIVYNNQGVVSRLSEEPFKLYSRFATTDKVDQDGNNIVIENIEIENQKWDLLYYNNEGVLLSQLAPELLGYMPSLNSDNTLMAAPLYYQYQNENSTEEFYVPVARCLSDNGSVLWTQPIVITQNQYASSTLNDWNGQFEINKENGTIMSTMVGAGIKTESNQFEGVLMGDIVAGAEFDIDNASGIGLYGFNEGAQSFFFGVNGKAFLGKSGRGRINFDGNSGTIASASYQQTRTPIEEDGKIIGYLPSPAGMMIDLDDGFIDMKGVSANVELTEQQFRLAKKNGEYEDCIDYRDYQTKYSNGEYIIPNSKSHIRIDTISPYFKIHSAKQTNDNDYIIYIGDNDYYLKSDDFEACDFDLSESGEVNYSGSGMKINLKEGSVNAYNFLLMSKNILIDNRNEADAYFAIKDNTNQILMLVQENPNGTNDYFLKTSNFQHRQNNNPGAGVKIDLGKGQIYAYDFLLQAGNSFSTSASGQVTYNPTIEMSSTGDPYLRIRDKNNNLLMNISNDNYQLQTANYKNNQSGMLIDLVNNSISAYSGFNLTAFQTDSTTNYIQINTNSAYPLLISGAYYNAEEKENIYNTFKVSWDGRITATDGVFTGTIHAKGGTFDGNITAKGQISGGLITGAVVNGGTLIGTNIYGNQIDVGYEYSNTEIETPTGEKIKVPKPGSGKFTVDSSGHLIANSATIGGWNVTETKLENNGIVLSGVPTNTTDPTDKTTTKPGIHSQYWTVDKFGVMRIKDLSILKQFAVVATGKSQTNITHDIDDPVQHTIFSVNSSGDMTFEGKLYLGPLVNNKRYLGFGWGGSAGGETGNVTTSNSGISFDTTKEGKNGFKTIRLDTPWSNNVGLATFYNGILVGWKEVSSDFSDFWSWLVGANNDKTNIGDANTPIYVEKGAIKAIPKKLGALAYLNDIKKKFNVTLSGKYDNTSYYEYSDKVPIAAITEFPTVFYFDPDYAVYYMDYDGYRYYRGTLRQGNPTKYVELDVDTYTLADDFTVTAKADIDVTLDGSPTATTKIDVSSSSATITVS